MNLTNIKKVADDIKTITIQGATNIAKSAFQVMKEEVDNQKFESIDEFKDFVNQSAHMLMEARDTEPMMFNGMKYALNILHTVPLHKGDKGGSKQ